MTTVLAPSPNFAVECKACKLVTTEGKACPKCVEVKLFCPTCYGNHMRSFHGQQVLQA